MYSKKSAEGKYRVFSAVVGMGENVLGLEKTQTTVVFVPMTCNELQKWWKLATRMKTYWINIGQVHYVPALSG